MLLEKTPTTAGERGTPTTAQKVLVPGDPEREIEAERKANGINLLEPVVNDLKALADRFGIEFRVS